MLLLLLRCTFERLTVGCELQIVAAVCFDRPALFRNAKADIHSWWKYAANAVMRLKRFGKVCLSFQHRAVVFGICCMH